MAHGRRWKLSHLTAFSHAQSHLRVQTVHGAIGARLLGVGSALDDRGRRLLPPQPQPLPPVGRKLAALLFCSLSVGPLWFTAMVIVTFKRSGPAQYFCRLHRWVSCATQPPPVLLPYCLLSQQRAESCHLRQFPPSSKPQPLGHTVSASAVTIIGVVVALVLFLSEFRQCMVTRRVQEASRCLPPVRLQCGPLILSSHLFAGPQCPGSTSGRCSCDDASLVSCSAYRCV